MFSPRISMGGSGFLDYDFSCSFLSDEHQQWCPVAASLRHARQGATEWDEPSAEEASLPQQSFKFRPGVLMARIIQELAPTLSQETTQPMTSKLHSTHHGIAVRHGNQKPPSWFENSGEFD